MLTKKAIIFTLDSILALIVTVTIITGTLSYMSQVSKIPYNKQALNRIGQDSLTLLEKDQILKQAVETGSNATIAVFLDSLPNQICVIVDLKATDQSTLQSTVKTGCSSSDESLIVRRVFIASFTTYYAEAELWYKRGSY